VVLPLVPILAGVAGGSLLSGALTKKGDTTTYSPSTTTTTTKTDARSFNIQYPTYQVQIDSPLASQTTKKEQTSTASATPTITTETGASGFDVSSLLPIALILGGAVVLKEVVKK
jgi:hypothetical protein